MSKGTEALRVRRVFTATPLAKEHERRTLRGRVRTPRQIPWQAFDRSRYPEPALLLATDAMMGLARGEYGAVDAFSRVASTLARNGAPLDLIAAAAEIPADEIRHAEYALRMASLYAGEEIAIQMAPDSFDMPWGAPAGLEALDILMLELPTISETLAAALIDACRERAKDPVARALFSAITADEVHHLRLGWYYFAWREPQWTRAERQRVSDAAGQAILHIERQFWTGRDAPRGCRSAAAALGVLDSKTQRSVVRRVMQREILPGLDALGLGASHAWQVRLRGEG